MTTIPIKLCQDCKFYIAEGGKCGHDSALIIDFVHGNNTHYTARVQRSHSGKNDCTPHAHHFEGKMIDITPRLRQIKGSS